VGSDAGVQVGWGCMPKHRGLPEAAQRQQPLAVQCALQHLQHVYGSTVVDCKQRGPRRSQRGDLSMQQPERRTQL
jgi:hypothetical protein